MPCGQIWGLHPLAGLPALGAPGADAFELVDLLDPGITVVGVFVDEPIEHGGALYARLRLRWL